MSEQQELDHYQEGNLWLEEAQQDVAWIHRLQNEAQTVEERRVSHLISKVGFLSKHCCFKIVIMTHSLLKSRMFTSDTT